MTTDFAGTALPTEKCGATLLTLLVAPFVPRRRGRAQGLVDKPKPGRERGRNSAS